MYVRKTKFIASSILYICFGFLPDIQILFSSYSYDGLTDQTHFVWIIILILDMLYDQVPHLTKVIAKRLVIFNVSGNNAVIKSKQLKP